MVKLRFGISLKSILNNLHMLEIHSDKNLPNEY